MVDPTNITNFNRSDYELEELILFCMAVAGKTASIISGSINTFIDLCRKEYIPNIGIDPTPFGYIRCIQPFGTDEDLKREIKKRVIESKLGKHSTLSRGFLEIIRLDLNLRTCTTKDLEQVCGIGPKTSRFFILHSRPNANVACIDVHIKRWLYEKGYTSNNYYVLEEAFLKEAQRLGRDIAELDLDIWNNYSIRSGKQNIDNMSIS